LTRQTENAEGTRAYYPNGKISDFTTLTSRVLSAVKRTLGVGGCGNICFGHLLVAVHRGQRRDAAATDETQLDRFSAKKNKHTARLAALSKFF
jgi:hypothetical protein